MKCQCPPKHSHDKLGHVKTCSKYVAGAPSQIDEALATPQGSLPVHSDGTKHDFTWAQSVFIKKETARADIESRFGVCRCGLRLLK
jgi:hypothetical protein